MKYDLNDIEKVEVVFKNGNTEPFIPKYNTNDNVIVDLGWSVLLKKNLKIVASNQTMLPKEYISKPYPNDI